MRRRVRTALGLGVPVAAARLGKAPDCVIVPAIGCKMPAPLEHALSRPDVRDGLAALRAWADGGASLAAACVGTFELAEAGLLDGEEATTTWWLAPMFRQRYPEVKLDESRMEAAARTRRAGTPRHGIELSRQLDFIHESPQSAKSIADTKFCRSVRRFCILAGEKNPQVQRQQLLLLAARLCVNVSLGGPVMFEQGDAADAGMSGADFSAVRALAAHLGLTPQQLDDWLQEPHGVPPKVLLSWICLWDLKRR